MSAFSWLAKIPGELGERLARVLDVPAPAAGGRPDTKPGKARKAQAIETTPLVEPLEMRRLLTTVTISAVQDLATEAESGAVFQMTRDGNSGNLLVGWY